MSEDCPLITAKMKIPAPRGDIHFDEFIERFRSLNKLTLDQALDKIAHWDYLKTGWDLAPELIKHAEELLKGIKA